MTYALAGFSNSGTGVWAYLDIREGDYLSFLYGARAFNLYKVMRKEAISEFMDALPWPAVTFRQSGKTYNYPFRLHLKPERKLNEPIVRSEFAYVAENLLLRAGYRKTQFQADQTTLQLVSQMGSVWDEDVEVLRMPNHFTFTPAFTRRKAFWNVPLVCSFNEFILQTAIRQKLADRTELANLLHLLGLDSFEPETLEVLSERALSEGHVDILIKDSVPIGMAKKIILEVKLDKAKTDDLQQLKGYMDEFGAECIGGALIAEEYPKTVTSEAKKLGIHLLSYKIDSEWSKPKTFAEIQGGLKLVAVQ